MEALTDALAVDVARAARMLGIGKTKLYEQIALGRVATIRIGNRRLVTRQALDDYLALLVAESQ